MTNRRGAWMNRRGQVDADAAIDQVIERQPQLGEQIQQLVDTLIDDSPYQARKAFSDTSVEDLAQGMRSSGFQGVLIVRPHGDLARRRSGRFELVFGHRRRAAWRRVCVEQGVLCELPVVVRDVTDEQMLIIGAQENLQRQDLDPIEEAQLVTWHERIFADKNQVEIGAMLGKSSDWVSMRSRIHRLPEQLKMRLRERPRTISQMLELGGLANQQPELAIELADRVVREGLTLNALRSLIRGYARPERRGAAISVQTFTSRTEDDYGDRENRSGEPRSRREGADQPSTNTAFPTDGVSPGTCPHSIHATAESDDLRLLEQAAAILMELALRAYALPQASKILQTVSEAEAALKHIRLTLEG